MFPHYILLNYYVGIFFAFYSLRVTYQPTRHHLEKIILKGEMKVMKMQKGIAISLSALLAVFVCVVEAAPATGIVGRTYVLE